MEAPKTFVLIAVVAVSLAILAFTVFLLLFPAMNSNVAAAWTQALGSIAAIVAAFIIPMYQHRKAEKAADEQRALENLRQLKVLNTLAISAATIINKAHEAFHSGNRGLLNHYFLVVYQPDDLKDIAVGIDQFHLQALASDIFGTLFLKRILIRADDYLAIFYNGNGTDEQYRNMVERLDKDRRYLEKLCRDVENAMLREGRRVNNISRVSAVMNADHNVCS